VVNRIAGSVQQDLAIARTKTLERKEGDKQIRLILFLLE
jgi:hypothetical protein